MKKTKCKVMNDIRSNKHIEQSRDIRFMFCECDNAYRCTNEDCPERI